VKTLLPNILALRSVTIILPNLHKIQMEKLRSNIRPKVGLKRGYSSNARWPTSRACRRWLVLRQVLFHKGRLRGREETIREILKGVSVHYEVGGQNAPESITKAIKAVSSVAARRKKGKLSSDAYSAQLCILGYAVGEACWLKGHRAGVKRKAPAEGNIRVDFSLTELLQLSWWHILAFKI
jgi:hypothetical protein